VIESSESKIGMRGNQFQVNGLRIGPWAILCMALAAGALAVLQPTLSLAQESESYEERIKNLEAEVEKLKAQQKQEEPKTPADTEDQELAEEVAAEVRGMTPEQRERWYRGIAAGQTVNYDASWHVGKPRQDVVDKGWWGIKGTPSEFRLSGWVQVALFHDFQGNALATAQEFSAGAVIVPTLKQPSTGVDAASSRIFLEFRHVFKGPQKRKNYPGVTHILFEMDLGGGRSGADYVPRVRQLWVQHGHLTFGQIFSTFSNASTWPAYFDRGEPAAFAGYRRPVLRYGAALSRGEKDDTHVLTPSLEQPISALTNATSAYNAPDMVLRYDYNPDWGNLMGAVIVRYHIAESTVTPGQRATAWVAAGTFTGWATIPTQRKDRLKWNVQIGPGVSGMMWDTEIAGGLDGTYVDATNSLVTTNAWGLWAAWERPWAELWNSVFMLGYTDIVNDPAQAATTFNNGLTATGTLAYEPWKNLFVVVEYFYGRRVNFDNGIGQDHRLNLVLRYMMNR